MVASAVQGAGPATRAVRHRVADPPSRLSAFPRSGPDLRCQTVEEAVHRHLRDTVDQPLADDGRSGRADLRAVATTSRPPGAPRSSSFRTIVADPREAWCRSRRTVRGDRTPGGSDPDGAGTVSRERRRRPRRRQSLASPRPDTGLLAKRVEARGDPGRHDWMACWVHQERPDVLGRRGKLIGEPSYVHLRGLRRIPKCRIRNANATQFDTEGPSIVAPFIKLLRTIHCLHFAC